MSQELVILLIQLFLKEGPATVAAFIKLFRTPNPTDSDWDTFLGVINKGLHER